MTDRVDIAHLRIEATDTVDPHLLVTALQRGFTAQPWAAGPEHDVATAVRSTVEAQTHRGEA